MKKIGLTGVMGAGKSSVIELLKKQGITVLDCDCINAQLLKKGEKGYCGLVSCFGDCLLDESREIDKQKMSDVIFSNKDKKAQAEAILHPLIKEGIFKALKQHEKEAIVVVEVPLLFEVQWQDSFDEVWVVSCQKEILLERLMKYRHIDQKEALRRLAHQISQEEKEAMADVVFYNNSTKENLNRQICDILNVIKE